MTKTETTTETMRAISQDVLGGPEVLHEVTLPKPQPGPAKILVKVHAAGMNPTDWGHRARAGFLADLPRVLGWDVSGTVEATGWGAALFQPGDEVFGMLPYPEGHGSHAEYVTAPSRAFVRKPASLDHVRAAALPLVALTAWQALFDFGGLRAGQRVLIHAAAGGVGHVAVQLARERGAYVIGTASAANHDLVRGLGADEMIDYRTTDFTEAVRDVDVVLDPKGPENAARSLASLRDGGILVSIVGLPDELAEQARSQGKRAVNVLVETDHAELTAIADLVDAGKLRPVVAGVYPLAEAAKAHALGETGHVAGKLVLAMPGVPLTAG